MEDLKTALIQTQVKIGRKKW